MATIKAFKAYRPKKELVEKIASHPYDVLNSEEAKEEAKGNPLSFLRVNKPEIDLDKDIDPYDESVYKQGLQNLNRLILDEIFIQDTADCLYIYRQTMNDVEQYGLVSCSSTADYFNDVIKKHEYTRPKKENDRIKHIDTLGAHVGPVFLTYPEVREIDQIVFEYAKENLPVYNFVSDDGIGHTLWVIDDTYNIEKLIHLFAKKVPITYIADGHHRAAAAAKVGRKRQENNPQHTGQENYNYFLSVLFPANQLQILDYNRVIRDLNNLSITDFLAALSPHFEIENHERNIVKPQQAHQIGMYINNTWYKLIAKPHTYDDNDPIKTLDVTVLSKYIIHPILGIENQRTDERIDFVGGIRGLKELEKRVNSGEMEIAFSLYPVNIKQLINIANTGNVMPPKSTWFEPKLRSGLVINKF